MLSMTSPSLVETVDCKGCSLLGIPVEIFDIIADYVQLEPVSVSLSGGVFQTKKHLFRLANTCRSLKYHLQPRWDTLTIRINGPNQPRSGQFFDKNWNLWVTNDNVSNFCRELIRGNKMDHYLVNIKTVRVIEQTPYAWGNCSSTIMIPVDCDFENVKQSHLFSWLLTMALDKHRLRSLTNLDIYRLDSEGCKEREPLAKIFNNSSALERFVCEFRHLPMTVNFSTSTAFQLADVELCDRVTSLTLSGSSFDLIKRNLKRKLLYSLPASLLTVRLDMDKVEAADLKPMLQNCLNLVELQLTVTALYNSSSVNWIPDSVQSLRIHDRSRCPIPNSATQKIECPSVKELILVAACGHNMTAFRFPNLHSLILLDCGVDKVVKCEQVLAQVLTPMLSHTDHLQVLEYGHSMKSFSDYIPKHVRHSLKKLRYSWYYSMDSKMDIMGALQSCINLEYIRTKYEPEIDSLSFAKLLWLMVGSTSEDCDIVLNARQMDHRNLFSQCISSYIQDGYMLDRLSFKQHFGTVSLDHFDKVVHYTE